MVLVTADHGHGDCREEIHVLMKSGDLLNCCIPHARRLTCPQPADTKGVAFDAASKGTAQVQMCSVIRPCPRMSSQAPMDCLM
jgi:hypothetical protein